MNKFALIISNEGMTADEVRQQLAKLEGAPAAPVVPIIQPSPALIAAAQAAAATPPAPPAAPAAPVAPVAPTNLAVDSRGLPWDERVHSGKASDVVHATNKDGSWKKRKGVPAAEVERIEAELHANLTPPWEAPAGNTDLTQIPAHLQQPAAPVAPVAPVAPPAPPAAPVAVTPAAPAPVAPARDFGGLMQQIGNLYRTQRADQSYPDTIVTRINSGFQIETVKTITDIANEPNMVEYAWQCLEVDGKAN